MLTKYGREAVTNAVRDELRQRRSKLKAGEPPPPPTSEAVGESVAIRIGTQWVPGPRPVINGTGVILHTNLARAPLSDEATKAVVAASQYVDLEFDLQTGERGDRQVPVTTQLCALTSAEAAYVTVNAAAAVLLALTAVAKGRDVIVSRGQSVEIGGGFRIPVVLQQSGARLVEVGTTNRTRLSDFEDAVTERTAAILNVHASNFRIVGFTETVALSELAHLARTRDIALIDDNGSGALLDTARFGIAHEPTVQESLAAGADLVAFSGDKLVGGPQAGILLGRRESIRRLRRHPLARAVRPDKMTLAALSATVHAYLRGIAESTIPIWMMIGQSSDDVHVRATRVRDSARLRGLRLQVVAGESTVGGGSLPGETLPTWLLVLPRVMSATRLREADPPIIARTLSGRTVIDMRTVSEREEPALLDGLVRVATLAGGQARS